MSDDIFDLHKSLSQFDAQVQLVVEFFCADAFIEVLLTVMLII